MGRKTWNLFQVNSDHKNRINIVLSKNENYLLEYANKMKMICTKYLQV